MSDIMDFRISQWNGKYVVVGEFDTHSVLSPSKFNTPLDALKELSKIVQREVLRRESSDGRYPYR